MRRRSRFLVPGLLPGLVLALTTTCTAHSAGGGSRAAGGGSSASASASGTSASATSTSSSTSSSSTSSSSSGSRVVSLVSCTGSSCSVTLGGAGASAQVFGIPVVFEAISGGRASVRVGGTPVTCTEGERVSAGRLQLSCTRVTADTVSFAGTMR